MLLIEAPTGERISISPEVLEHFHRHRQLARSDREAGGQLFARIADNRWHIERATGPRRSDWRSRFGFRPDRRAERSEIHALFQSGLHYVGDWHTHPEARPHPSPTDIQNIAEEVRLSQHELAGFLMMIVGTEAWPGGLWASFHLVSGAWLTLEPKFEGFTPPDEI